MLERATCRSETQFIILPHVLETRKYNRYDNRDLTVVLTISLNIIFFHSMKLLYVRCVIFIVLMRLRKVGTVGMKFSFMLSRISNDCLVTLA